MAPVIRPESGRSTSVSELAFTLTTAPKLLRKSLLTMIGCAPRTKIVAAAFPPRPTRFVLDAPAALFSIRLWATRRSPWCVSITLKLSNVPSMGVCPPPYAMVARSMLAEDPALRKMPPQSPATDTSDRAPLVSNVPPPPNRLSPKLVKITGRSAVPSAINCDVPRSSSIREPCNFTTTPGSTVSRPLLRAKYLSTPSAGSTFFSYPPTPPLMKRFSCKT